MVSELCLPLRAGERVIGVLNAESPTLLGDDARWELERCADLLSRRIEQLGGPEVDGAPGAAAGPRGRAAGGARGS